MYDVVIVGGSFAGLAAAMPLRGRRVLLVEQYPIGSHQTSTCAMPLATMAAVGGAGAIQERHDALVAHTGGRAIRFPLRTPYVTFEYRALCRAMLAQTDAEVRQARATGRAPGAVVTDGGAVHGRFVVDASGWRAGQWRGPHPASPPQLVGYGLETELPVGSPLGPGLHFFFERSIVRSGYAWAFPCGATTRIGVCAFERGVALRPLLAAFLGRFGLRCGATHGGVIAIQRGVPLDGPTFVVGDAAGQCLPLTAEGIRPAIFHGREAGRLLAAALAGDLTAEEARARYGATARRTARFHALMVRLQCLMARSPERLRATAARAYSPAAVFHPVMRCYLRGSGWM